MDDLSRFRVIRYTVGPGRVVGRIKGIKVYGTDGRYVGTIVSDRLVYRSTDNAEVSSSFSTANLARSARARHAGSAIWGDEPDIPDNHEVQLAIL